jgi:DNA adenine methylase
MKYMGSKRRIAKDILPIILENRNPNQWYVEPFCGGCNMIELVNRNRIANDYNEYVAEMWNALVNRNWQPPTEITEGEYNDIKANKEQYPKELVGFTGIAVTFGSTWFGTYARNKRGTNYAMEGRNNLMKQVERLQGTIFTSSSYCGIALPENSIIYCDPPYEGVAGYKDKFNHIAFWQWCREKTNEGHSVFISEYNAPNDFYCIWQSELKTNMNAKYETKPVEKLFKFSPKNVQ